jgi:hypothetical protein
MPAYGSQMEVMNRRNSSMMAHTNPIENFSQSSKLKKFTKFSQDDMTERTRTRTPNEFPDLREASHNSTGRI